MVERIAFICITLCCRDRRRYLAKWQNIEIMKQLLVIIYLYNLCTYEMQMLSEAFTLILLHRDNDGLGKCHKNFGFSLL